MRMLLAVAVTVAALPAAYADHPVVGLMTDVGLPDAGTISLAVRPVRALRVEAGVGDDGVGPGVRGGVTWIPLSSWATPVVGVGYGRFFERDANPLVRSIMGDQTFSSPLLDKVGYDFAVARAGVELGRKHVTFFLHAGVAHVSGAIHNISQASMSAASGSGGSGSNSNVSISSSDANVSIWGVSANLGIVVYLK